MSSERIIHVEKKNVYGNELIYPACKTSKEFCRLQGRKTLIDTDIKILILLGYKIEHVQITFGGK